MSDKKSLNQEMDEREAAWAKSFILLMENLTVVQCKALETFGYIPVTASDDSRWLVLPSGMQNAFDLDNEQLYCLTMEDRDIPPGDTILGVVLSIQGDVDEFRNVANELNTRSWVFNSLRTEAYVASSHMPFLAQSYMPWRQEDLMVSDKEWQDFVCCHDETCNLDARENMCDFHRGAFMMMTLVNDGNTFKTPMQLNEYIGKGVSSVRRLVKGDVFDHDTVELLFTDKAEKLLDTFDSLEGWLKEETARRTEERQPLVDEYGKELGNLLDIMVTEAFGPEGY